MIADDDIRRAVAPNAFQAGLQYQMDRRVRDLRVAADGATIDAQVLGSGRSPYHQAVQLIRASNGKLAVVGSCTCPVGFNCKHVAAVLFEYQQRAPANVVSPMLRPSTCGVSQGGPINSDAGRSPAALPTTTEAPLPFEVDAWLRSLDAAQEEESEDYPPSVRKRLLYVLDRGPQSGGLIVDVRSVDLKRDGTPGGASRRHQTDHLLRPSSRTSPVPKTRRVRAAPTKPIYLAVVFRGAVLGVPAATGGPPRRKPSNICHSASKLDKQYVDGTSRNF